ncbi:MAG: SBBP repeat-containing protein [Candidatus Helarchaeota archaeon]|nr:SBBP repeat-containing protein [Candidatus Helarchaeota archaeon]
MQKLYGKVLYTVTILGMLLMLTISGGMLVNSTPKSVQNQDASPITLYTTAENNALRWNTTWGSVGGDYGYGVAVDASGFVYCVGETNWFGAGGYDLALVKFAPNGTRLWNITWGGTGSDEGMRIVIDASGSPYCLGDTTSFGAGSYDFALVKFAPNGTRLWNTTWGGAANDYGNGVAVDAAGNLYCSGYTSSFGAGNQDMALVKFDSNGTKIWNTTWGGADIDLCYDIVLDASGSPYCTGYTNSWAGNNDLALVKFAPTGTQLWNTTWGGTGDDYSYVIAMDASGAIYCTGATKSFGAGGLDLVLIKFAPTGTQLWNMTWGGTGNEYSYDIVVDTSGALYCVGWTNSFGAGSDDFALVKIGYQPGEPGGIPGFELVYLLIGLLALIPLVQRRRFYRTLS